MAARTDEVEDFIQEVSSEGGSAFSDTDRVPREKAVMGDRDNAPRVQRDMPTAEAVPLRRALDSDDPTVSRVSLLNGALEDVDDEDLVPAEELPPSARESQVARHDSRDSIQRLDRPGSDGSGGGAGGSGGSRGGDDDGARRVSDERRDGLGARDAARDSRRSDGSSAPSRRGDGESSGVAFQSRAHSGPEPFVPRSSGQRWDEDSHAISPRQAPPSGQQQGRQAESGRWRDGGDRAFGADEGAARRGSRDPEEGAAPPAERGWSGSASGAGGADPRYDDRDGRRYDSQDPGRHPPGDRSTPAPIGRAGTRDSDAAAPRRSGSASGVPSLQDLPPRPPHDPSGGAVRLPDSFAHSMLRHMERSGRCTLSSAMAPRLSRSGLSYEDMRLDPETRTLAGRDLWTWHMSMTKAAGVPEPPSELHVVERSARICLKEAGGAFVGSSLTIPATAASERDAHTWNFGGGALVVRAESLAREMRLYVELTARVVLPPVETARGRGMGRRGSVTPRDGGRHRRRGSTGSIESGSSSGASDALAEVPIEQVDRHLTRGDQGPVAVRPGELAEVCCGWFEVPIPATEAPRQQQSDLQSQHAALQSQKVLRQKQQEYQQLLQQLQPLELRSHTFAIMGGTAENPLGVGELRTTKRGLRRLTGSTKVVERIATLRVSKMPSSLAANVRKLPATCVVGADVVEHVATFREMLADALLRRRDILMVAPIHNPALALFPRIADAPGLLNALASLVSAVTQAAGRSARNAPNFRVDVFTEVCLRVWGALHTVDLPSGDTVADASRKLLLIEALVTRATDAILSGKEQRTAFAPFDARECVYDPLGRISASTFLGGSSAPGSAIAGAGW